MKSTTDKFMNGDCQQGNSLFTKIIWYPGMVAHAYNPNIRGAEAGDHYGSKASLGYKVRDPVSKDQTIQK